MVDLLKVQLTPEYFTIVVRRSHFLKDALQKCRRDFFNPSKLIQVCVLPLLCSVYVCLYVSVSVCVTIVYVTIVYVCNYCILLG